MTIANYGWKTKLYFVWNAQYGGFQGPVLIMARIKLDLSDLPKVMG